MNSLEREEARRWKKHQEMMEKDPQYKALYESAQKKALDEKRRKKILSDWGNVLPENETSKPLSDEEMRRNKILEQY